MSSQHWRDDAACADAADPELFSLQLDGVVDPSPTKRWGMAVAYCHECPVRDECFADGVSNSMDGVWGGVLLAHGTVETRLVVPPKCLTCGVDLNIGRARNSDRIYCSTWCANNRSKAIA